MRVLVVGGGFAGAMAAVRMAGKGRGRIEVTLVNPRAAFVNRIRMHQVAVGRPVAFPSLPSLLGADVSFVEGSVVSLDPDAGSAKVRTTDGFRTISFDRVILAMGSTAERPPVDGPEHVHTVGDIDAARRLLPVLADLAAGSTATVVGGGLTGLETVAEIAQSRPDLQTRLVTAGEVADWFSERGGAYVRDTLHALGVRAVGGGRVERIESGRVHLRGGAEMASDLTVWCGGFVAPPLARESGLAVDEQGAVLTDGRLRSISHPSVLAVGDSAHAPVPGGGRYSMSCQFAFPSGAYAADALVAEARGRTSDADDDLDLGFLARCVSLGRNAAIFQLTDRNDVAAGRRAVTGRTATLLKRVQLGGISSAVSTERHLPGTTRWPKADRAAAAGLQTVAG